MGSAASVAVEDASCALVSASSRMDEARQYFGNEILMRGFWAPIDQDGGGSVTLTGIRNYLRNTNPENVVAIYAGPFLGPFATSAFCLKQAYWTCTGRTNESDPDNMELQDHEFKNMLKNLFFYHSLYSNFGESCEHSAPMSLENFTEAIEDLLDESLSPDKVEQNYTKLGANPTFGAYVRQMTAMYLSDDSAESVASATLIEEKLRAGYVPAGRKSKSFVKEIPGGSPTARARANSLGGGSEHMGTLAHETISCIKHPCKDIDGWIKQIQELGVVPFKSLIDDISVSRVVIGQDMNSLETCVMFLWHLDNGDGYKGFEEANLGEGGVFVQAAEEGVIGLPFDSLSMNSLTHDGWNARLRPGDVMNLAHFSTKSHVGFTDSLQEDIDSLGRTSGALQNYVGKTDRNGGAILSHYTASNWALGGEKGAKAFQADPPVKYMVSGAVTNMTCVIKATYEVFTWLADAQSV